MTSHDVEAKQRELDELRARVAELEREVSEAPEGWQASGFYTAYYATTGFMLGAFGAAASLLFNVVGSLMTGRHPLELIRVYLTFPLGERALEFTGAGNGLILAIGCCLYLGTGMLLGVPVYLALSRFAGDRSLAVRLAVATVVGLLIYVVNFQLILSWLQPLLFGGNWIVEGIPGWVAVLTHLVFTWTMALLYPWGQYTPYQPPSYESNSRQA